MDIVEFPESEEGTRYILVASNYFTRWMEAHAIKIKKLRLLFANLLMNFFRLGSPEQLHSNQGHSFESDVVAEMCWW